ncbi:secreted RxLR effector protein 161-like [Primulina huaijiensis]|uniref:secreted RxLR effector protein 161-like n=1 Tax=Primulina huaijiensis TaxID=1492673 RepID=UPI003CC7307F
MEAVYMKSVPYSNAVGSVMYSMMSTRPDIAYGLGLVSRFMSKPSREHWQAVKWLLRYLKGTSKLKLVYSSQAQSTCDIIGYCDSDFAADLDKRRSLSGYVFTFGGNVVSWKSSLQHVVALSTTEAEYISLTEAVKEPLWIKGFVGEIGFEQNYATIFCDLQSAIHLSKNAVFHEKTKHVDVRLHFVRDIITRQLVSVRKIDTKVNPADVLTKIIPVSKLKDALGLLKIQE